MSDFSPETEAKVQSVENDIATFRDTGNPQYAYYAIQRLFRIIEQERRNWQPEADAK